MSTRLFGILLVLVIVLYRAGDAEAQDYTPGDSPFLQGVGSNGAKIINQGTVLDPSDTASVWNQWTNKSKLVYTTYEPNCGSLVSCIIFRNDGTQLDGTSCVLPEVTDPEFVPYAATNILAGPSYNSLGQVPGCSNIGSLAHPIFVVTVNNEKSDGPGWGDQEQRWHVARHETGHALLLGHPGAPGADNVSCWATWGYLQPVMKGRSNLCQNIFTGLYDQNGNPIYKSYPRNYSATFNEAVYVVIRNNW